MEKMVEQILQAHGMIVLLLMRPRNMLRISDILIQYQVGLCSPSAVYRVPAVS